MVDQLVLAFSSLPHLLFILLLSLHPSFQYLIYSHSTTSHAFLLLHAPLVSSVPFPPLCTSPLFSPSFDRSFLPSLSRPSLTTSSSVPDHISDFSYPQNANRRRSKLTLSSSMTSPPPRAGDALDSISSSTRFPSLLSCLPTHSTHQPNMVPDAAFTVMKGGSDDQPPLTCACAGLQLPSKQSSAQTKLTS